MEGSTHILGGVASGLLCSQVMSLSQGAAAFVIAVAAIGSLVPDVDMHTSKMGSKVKPVSFVINKLFGHRTLFHSPILYTVIYLSWISFFPEARLLATAFATGVASHLLLDMLNYKGIPIFYPFGKRYHLATIKCGGSEEIVFRVVLGIFLFWQLTLWMCTGGLTAANM